MIPESDSRRNFVKKSITATIAMSQPAFFAGLVRATGGEGETTVETTIVETTWMYETTFAWTGVETTIFAGETTAPVIETTVPIETTHAETSIPQSTETPVPKLFKMHCTSPAVAAPATTKTFGLFGGAYDSDPTGWVKFGDQWYRVFVQTVIEVDKVKDGDGVWYGEVTVNFTCKGRYAYVPADSDHDTTAQPPADTTVAANGASGWTDWVTWPRQAKVSCAESDGKITRSKGDGDPEQSGDTGTNGSAIETGMPTGEGGTTTCTFKYKAPWGGFGDQITATVEFVSEDRYGK